jgi:glutamate racemase
MIRPRVLVFDSGFGGLSIAACLRRHLPGVDLVYVADTAFFPYGAQSSETVIGRSMKLVIEPPRFAHVDLIVVACNTASTVVLPHMRERASAPVVGVVPAIKPAARLTKNQRIGILATPATVRRPYTEALIREFAADCEVTCVGSPELVAWAEGKVLGNAVPLEKLRDTLSPLAEAGVDTIVLGCTHYPLLIDELREVLPEVTHWVDSGDAIAKRVAFLLTQAGFGEAAMRTEDLLSIPVYLSGEAPPTLSDFMWSERLLQGTVVTNWAGG